MGTRHLIAVMINGEYKIAQYGQWDGYPSGQGIEILEFLQKPENIEQLKKSLKKTRFIDNEKDKDFIDAYEKVAPKWSNEPDMRTQAQRIWFEKYISRDVGANILYNIKLSEDDEIILKNSIDFAGDSLFCEYAYVIDFDKGVLEIYSGFNKTPVESGRFKDFIETSGKEYHSVNLIKTYDLNNLPNETQFLKDLTKDDSFNS